MIKKAVIVKAIAFDSQGKVLLVRRSDTAPRRPLEWDLPGGFVDEEDGSYREACLRELQEETGLKSIDGAIHLGYTESRLDDLYSKDMYDVSWLYFTVEVADSKVTLSYEHDMFDWVTLDHAEQMITYDRQLRALVYVRKAIELEKKS